MGDVAKTGKMQEPDASPRAGPYQLFMLGLCTYVLLSLSAQAMLQLDPDTLQILDYADIGICVVFFADFIRSLVIAPDRRRYFFTWGWLDLISSIPTIDVFRWGRAARIFRILRVLRGLRATRLLGEFALRRRAESAFWAAMMIAILVTIFGSIAVLHLETTPGATIRDADDALWWAFVTITTVGYGDEYPITPSGRALAAVIMTAGIGLFGTFTAFLASRFLEPVDTENEREIAALRRDVQELRSLIVESRRTEEPGEKEVVESVAMVDEGSKG